MVEKIIQILYCTLKTAYDVTFLPYDEVLIQKGAYLYRLPEKGGEKVGAAPWIIKACDYRINELKNTLKGASDASTRIDQYKQVKRGNIPLSSIAEQNKSYIAKTGSTNSKVTEVQTRLRELGYTSQTITGKLDSTTLNNIAYFQSQSGIYMTGWLDNETYNAIMSYGTNNNYVAPSTQNSVTSNQKNHIEETQKGILEKVFDSYSQEAIMKNEIQAGLLTGVISNISEPFMNAFDVVDRAVDINRYGYSERHLVRQEIIDKFRNGASQYLKNPGYYYVGQMIGDYSSLGLEFCFFMNGSRCIVEKWDKIKDAIYLGQAKMLDVYGNVIQQFYIIVDAGTLSAVKTGVAIRFSLLVISLTVCIAAIAYYVVKRKIVF